MEGKDLMTKIVNLMKNEPAVVSGLILAAIALATAFGLDLSNEQVGAITAFVSAAMSFVVRSQVTPSVRVSAERDKTGHDVAGEAVAPEIAPETPVEVVEAAPEPPVETVPTTTDVEVK